MLAARSALFDRAVFLITLKGRRHVRKFMYSLAALAAFSLAGCGGSDKGSDPKPAEAKPASAKPAPAAPQAAEALLLSLIPEPPTADGCLKVLVSGSGKADYRWAVNGQELSGQSGNTLCQGFRRGDEVLVSVRDGKRTGEKRVTIANAPPRITEVSVNADGIQKRADLVVKPTVIDVDDDLVELRYQWYVNGEADPFLTGDTLPAGKYARGDKLRFTVVATDGRDESKLYQSEAAAIANAPPQIVSQPPQRFEAMEYSYQLKARDPDGDKLTYKFEKAPAGMTVNRATGLVVWPLAGVKAGVYPVKIVVSDPDGAAVSQEYTLTLGAPAVKKL